MRGRPSPVRPEEVHGAREREPALAAGPSVPPVPRPSSFRRRRRISSSARWGLPRKSGDRAADSSLFALLYEDLQELARARRARMAGRDSLRTTELVHEAWLRLYGGGEPTWESRRHFFGAAANAMRNVLVDRARRRATRRRDATPVEEREDLPELVTEEPLGDVLALHLALEELERSHERPARVVVLRFFAGLSMEEIATVLDVSLATAERDWRFGRSWLQRAMAGGAE